jgi:hypothetical protein
MSNPIAIADLQPNIKHLNWALGLEPGTLWFELSGLSASHCFQVKVQSSKSKDRSMEVIAGAV